MTTISPHEVTRLLQQWRDGDQSALDRLMPLVYDELRRRAKQYMRRERSDHTLQPTALVHEAYLRLVELEGIQWQDRAHFFAIAARLMRRILVDYARRHDAARRGGHECKVSLEEAATLSDGQVADLVALDDALTSLAANDPTKSRIVELRLFGGLSVHEMAEVLSVSPATVRREWRMAKAWLYREISRRGEYDE